MNFNFYIFGNPQGQQSQYPQDYTKDIFTSLMDDVAGSRAVIFRQADLMHYVFIENLGEGKIIGLCLIFNKAGALYPKKLFGFLEDVVLSHALQAGKFIAYNSEGDIDFINKEFCDDTRAYEYIKSVINSSLESSDKSFGLTELRTNYSGDNKTVYADFNDPDEKILMLSRQSNKVIIEDEIGIQKNSTFIVMSSLQAQIAERDESIKFLNEKVSTLEQQKKQYRKLIVLFALLLCCCGGMYFLYDSLNQTEDDLAATKDELTYANSVIVCTRNSLDSLNQVVDGLNSSLESERSRRAEAEEKVAQLVSASPLIITGGSFSFSGEKYTCNYYSAKSGNKALKFRVIDDSSGDVIESREISPYLEKGSGSFYVYLNHRTNSSRWYTFEILDGNRIIGGSRH